MRTPVDRSRHLLIWIAGFATSLFCAAGIGVFMAWMPTAVGSPKDHTSLTALSPTAAQPAGAQGDNAQAGIASDAPITTKCAECGVIESVQEIAMRGGLAVESTASYAFTVRFRDGSTRVFVEAIPRRWRSGAQIRVID